MNILLIFHNDLNPDFGFTVVICPRQISYKVASLYEENRDIEALEVLKEHAVSIKYVPSGNILHKQILDILEKRISEGKHYQLYRG